MAFAHRLPVEVLALIFRVCFPSNLPEPSTDLASAIFTSAPCNISQVCSRWRTVALSLPALWAQWFVSIRNATSRDVWKLVGILRTWRDRSRVEPLSAFIAVAPGIGFEEQLKLGGDAKEAIEALFDLVYELEPRWCRMNLSIDAPSSFIRGSTRCLEPTKLTHLQELHVSAYPRYEMPSCNIRFFALRATPPAFCSLRTLVLTNDKSSKMLSPSLTRQCLVILHHAPQLETFEVTLVSPISDENFPNFPVVPAPSLRRLVLDVCEQPARGFACKFILDHLIAPALEKLIIKSKHSDGIAEEAYETCGFVSDFLSRSRPPLTELTLCMAMTQKKLMAILRQLPYLTVLHLGVNLFNALLKEGSKDALCPGLQRLKFPVSAIEYLRPSSRTGLYSG
ncbi:hypothetical protein SCHPADRAFT_997410 [Schizopora paradoxa]|uniref:Uncharacterized protein n=1 Tax=Schizopora paradoxa TaxID=27342 RepID=A0A0H2RNA7_9AGAM|nr:hypothetical protein SCHPADRAFT_997410 [Schizopora paradoxa]